MTRLTDRVALVTGAGRGIGRAIAIAFGREGAKVAVTSRSTSELDEVVGTIREAGGTAIAIPADLAASGESERLVADVSSQLGPIEILVNNAGLGSSSNPKPVVDFDDDFWEMSLKINLTAPYLLSKAVLPGMLAKKQGRIITVASINGKMPSFHGAAYAASKHGVIGLMRTLAAETAAEGITVNSICPGPVKSLMNDKRIAYDAERLGRNLEEHERSLTPIGGRLDPEDISPMAVYLASDEARAVTGQAFNVCGGLVYA
ncbi:MAG: SDR family NAD(P)-dependent oxidoreductase [Planctomycetaceae bacterium]|jgi:NAD(P)-dependent dehydrogenase (short-subunit alcohol dehydrogenase family)|nr:SDR family NAD(P)-dependent oxidoreductase [Planctomycetaceae bacterium]MBT6158234.1 SDR family NAD(P)-dependent oxidoreductase [Planctomycetaceae bacterium]MBT6487584.1 SDR family NAD(P)-dependent oxidoreductase [Planctomycetaceae bacterium]MBT6493242.1 SDR family NAD(P)-dependent oxidoreductase [Planctomycetaceae bacterium]